MGGAAGHLQHVFEDLDLSFHDVKSIISKAAAGDLEKVSEKLDGINLMFSWSTTLDELRVARNASNIKSGGLSETEIADMFKDRGNLTEAFKQAFVILYKAFSALSLEDKERYFRDAKTWYSIEIIYTKNPNVISYDKNTIVFHSWPILTVLNDKIVKDDNAQFVNEIDKHISRMQKAVSKSNWNVLGPVVVKMKDLSSGQIADETISRLNSIMSSANVSDSDTLGDFLRQSFIEEAKKQNINDVVISKVIDRCLSLPGAPTLIDLKRILKTNPSQLEIVTKFVKNSTLMQKKIMQPIEKLIHDFAVKILDNVKSTLIQDNDAEILRLRQEVSKAIAAIKNSNDTSAMEVLQTHLTKLGSVENITSPMEGVVFIYNGNAYKFTGAFAPANQLLGLFRYGKRKMQQNESINLLKTYVQLLVEDDVSGRYRLPSEELTSSEKVAKEKYEAAEAELKAWDAENKKKEAFIAKCKELGISPTSDSKVAKVLKNKPEYAYNVKLLQKQRKTLQDAFEKLKDEYALYEPSISGFQRKQNSNVTDSEKSLPDKDVKTLFDINSIKPLKFYSWDDPRWANAMKTTKYGGDAGVGLGPGEARIAKIIGGKVQGSGVSFDVVAKNGTAWEIKAFDSASSLIRPGAKGRIAFDSARSRLVSILRQLRNFVTVTKKLDIITSDKDIASSITFIDGFLNDEIDSILGKGEISRSRIKSLYTVMKIANQIIKKWSDNPNAKQIDTKLSFNNKTVRVDKGTYIDVAKKVQKVVGDIDILSDFESQELAVATLNDEAFKNPAKFFDLWFDSVKASTVFGGVDGMFIVTGSGFMKIPFGLFNKVLKFDSVSQNLPKFNFILVDDLQM